MRELMLRQQLFPFFFPFYVLTRHQMTSFVLDRCPAILVIPPECHDLPQSVTARQ